MKIEQPNHTQYPNVILDKWMKELSGGEFKVLSLIIRKTAGWHKQSDVISYSQFMEYTGMSNRGIIDIVRKLDEIGIIKTRKHPLNNGQFNIEYRINYNWNSEESSQPLKNDGEESSLHDGEESSPSLKNDSEESSQPIVKKVHTQKKNINKGKLNKDGKKEMILENQESPYNQFIDIFHKSYLKRFNIKPTFDKAKGAHIKLWIKNTEGNLELWKQLVDIYLNDKKFNWKNGDLMGMNTQLDTLRQVHESVHNKKTFEQECKEAADAARNSIYANM